MKIEEEDSDSSDAYLSDQDDSDFYKSSAKEDNLAYMIIDSYKAFESHAM